jgi:hypothetical protein
MGSEGCRGFRLQISRQSAYGGVKFVRPRYKPPLTSGVHFWYLFLSDSESTPGP